MLPAGLVHLWLARPSDLLRRGELLASYLSGDEVARAATYKLEEPRLQFTLARGWLRFTLASYAGVKPASLSFGTTGNGKPVLNGHETLFFNLSHTARAVAIAISGDRPVGVDVEQVQSRRSLDGIVRQQFHPNERADYELANEAKRLEVFYRIWTCKEAYLKGLGRGFSQSLTSFAMRPTQDGRYAAFPNLDDQPWSLISEIKDDCALAIAAPNDWQIEFQ